MCRQDFSKFKIKNSNGFSLLEILVGMAIVAVLVAVAIPRFGNQGDKIAREQATRLLAAVDMVRDLAVIQDKEYGLSIDDKGYKFLVLKDDDEERPPEWVVIEDIEELAAYEFPEEVEVNVAIDGENIFEEAEDEVNIFEEEVDIFEDEDEKEKVDPPQVYFLSTGEQNQFTLAIASAEYYQDDDEPVFFRIKGELTGVLAYQGPLPGDLFSDIERDYSDYLEEE
ncbi:prepilin-type N-terminal cleavage/methylation domain-containing protein [Aliikangiella coralliicola]|uniref:Prepilin-type N-terminal cleavage/methylation domain-containing protein n=1 Tax=Aliikangiella coralliicola TaxID=2592383 RepID=A0A545U7Q5_9GAMM|nr:prepilin-type N-terminal cleavage/methylation domain-containing protein [Aliikangiella coralliicola]TQV85502.1 prepilin-type N-terminal cleavage/methylation domain-containing protein [Aliikangiella coralliicola]